MTSTPVVLAAMVFVVTNSVAPWVAVGLGCPLFELLAVG